MMIIVLMLILISGGGLAWIAARFNTVLTRWISLAATTAGLIWTSVYWFQIGAHYRNVSPFFLEYKLPWIPRYGITFHLAIDGMSLILIVLTLFLGVLSVLTSWREITSRVGFFHFNLLWILAGIIGVFSAMDLFLFYFFWEMMLIPMYFLISIWGHENRIYAAVKFFIFTQASGLLMLASIIALYWWHGNLTGQFTFDYFAMIGTQLPSGTARWIMLGFFVAFAVKLPMVPFHTWLPDAHTEAPTAGSVILAGLLLKTGGYGLMRFVLPLFPDASREFAPIAMTLGVIGIIYGAVLALGQTDLKRLVAYTSVSHLGFVLLGVYSFTALGWHGAMMQMICHGISTGALFILVGGLYERIHTRDLRKMGGIWTVAPRMGAAAMIFAMASLGLPGMGNFVSEILVLVGSYAGSPWLTAVAAAGLVLATVYSLHIVQKAFHGKTAIFEHGIPDLHLREVFVMAVLTIVIIWLGVFPQPVIRLVTPTIQSLQSVYPVSVPPVSRDHSVHYSGGSPS